MSKLVQKLPALANTAAVAARPKLQTFLHYAKVELTPPSPTDIPAIVKGFTNVTRSALLGKYWSMEMRDVLKNTLVTIEVLGWFFIGECIGKRSIIAYKV